MENKLELLNEFEMSFDLERIENMSVPEKFKLVKLIDLLYQEAHFASRNGLLHLDKSKNYTLDKTYNLFAMLVVNGTKFEVLRKIIENYSRNFDKSDVYYSRVVILGLGVMMIDKGFSPTAIYNYLMHLLGKTFLLENQKYSGKVETDKEAVLELNAEVEYKPFEGNMRQLKYEILALLKYSHMNGIEKTTALVNSQYHHTEAKFFYNMLNIDCPETQKYMVESYDQDNSRTNRLMLHGMYAIFQKLDVFTAHYLFNSIIGKYSRYDKDSGEIDGEVELRLQEILKAGV